MGLRGGKYQKTGENYTNKIFMVYTPFNIIWGYQITEAEMGRSCGTRRRDVKLIQDLVDLDLDVKYRNLKQTFK